MLASNLADSMLLCRTVRIGSNSSSRRTHDGVAWPTRVRAASSAAWRIGAAGFAFYGAQTAKLSIVDNAVGSPQTASLTANVINPQAGLDHPSLSFGTVKVNSSTTKSATLSNSGTTALAITKVAVSGTNPADFTINSTACGNSLNAGKSCTISVTFKPGAKGSRSATLTVTDNARSATQTVSLTGTGN